MFLFKKSARLLFVIQREVILFMEGLTPVQLRENLVAIVLEWERRYGVAPPITSAISEYDAACLVGHTPESFASDCIGRTAVTRGMDFRHKGLRYQIKANRPSGRQGSDVTLASKATNYDWDMLVWLLYDREFKILEAWEWSVEIYRAELEAVDYVRPVHMRRGRSLVER